MPRPDDTKDADRLAQILEAITATQAALAERVTTATATDGDQAVLDRLTTAFEALTATQKEVANATKRPSNQFPPEISPYNLRGDKDFPRPRLKCQYVTPWCRPDDDTSLTREEVELLNLLEPGTYPIRRTDGTRIELAVLATYPPEGGDVPTRLTVTHPTAFKQDQHTLLPSLVDTLRMMLRSKPSLHAKAKLVVTMEEEEDLIRQSKLNDGTIADRVVSVGA